MGRLRTALVLLAVAALLLAPSLVFGTLVTHSSPQNLTWAAQFADQFRAGVAYPRWMPESFGGLGGPAFYFYPPLAFLVDALVSVVTFDALPISYRLSLSAALLLWGSGLAMYAWLAEEVEERAVALYGSLGYMAAPYHLLDHYFRGAYAEFAAYAFLPLAILAIRRIAGQRRDGPPLLAVSYGALLMTHLPTALLASATLLPAYVLFRAWRAGNPAALSILLRCAAGGVLGAGLAAAHLWPALDLQSWISAEKLWTAGYSVENWFLLTPERWRKPADMMEMIAWFAAAYAIAALGILLLLRGGAPGTVRRTEATFWAFLALVCLLLMSGLVPWFWQIVPFVARVQFPWRLMVVVEFAVITSLCLALPVAWARRDSVVFASAAVCLVLGSVPLLEGVVVRSVLALNRVSPPVQDAREYLPAGFPQRPDAAYDELALEPLRSVPAITCAPPASVCRVEEGRFGAMRLTVESDGPTTVVLRRFFFPAWQIDGIAAVAPTDPLKLVSFVAPAGRHTFHLRRTALPEEQWGWALSSLSLILLLVWTVAEWRIRRP
ncbi:MAG: hypothetical protein ACT4O6_10765 [Reyranella sp.]